MSRREAAIASVPGIDDPVFSEPWQAEAFAIVVALHERGLFSWAEWAEALSLEVHEPECCGDGSDYYEHWLNALEKLLSAKGIAGGGRSRCACRSLAARRACHTARQADRSGERSDAQHRAAQLIKGITTEATSAAALISLYA